MGVNKEIEKQKQERLGEENKNKFGTLMKIIEYNNATNIIVEFQDKYRYKILTRYFDFKIGNVKNPYDKTVYNIGYLGEGKYKVSKDRKITKQYKVWNNILQRCYDPYFLNTHPTYRDCIVCKEWLCFQNFAEWWDKYVYNCNGEQMALDKDILIKGNKIYSPDTCLIVPQRINTLFIKRQDCRGEYPIGVSPYYYNRCESLTVHCSILNKNGTKISKTLGYFPLDKPFQAFICYKQFKENYIKQVADEYKDLIPKKLYDAMYRYEVEIND